MSEKYDNNSQQVQKEDVNSNPPSDPSSSETTEECKQSTDIDMKRGALSRASTLESIKEEDSEVEERDMLESFKSITDVFGNGYEEEQVVSTKPSPAGTSLTSKSARSLSVSEDTDSLDEEVRQIMQRSEEKSSQSHEATNEVAINSLKDVMNDERKATNDEEEKKSCHSKEKPKDEEKEEKEEKIEDEIPEEKYSTDEESGRASSVPTDTESLSSDSEPDTDSESLPSDEKSGHWSPGRDDDSSSDEFDLDEYINKLCSHQFNSDSSSDDSDSDSEAQNQKIINKVMRQYAKKYSRDEDTESESESDSDDDSDLQETDLEEDDSDNVEVKEEEDDDSSEYSTSDDDIDSDFLDDESASISTESSSSGDYEVDHDTETVQAVNEEIPYLSDQTIPSHEVVFKYYLGKKPESCPEKIEVQEGDLKNNIALDNTLTSRSVINLRWPFTSYYVKEFDLDSEAPTYEEDGLLPCYKSMKSSASFPGRRRDVMLGRVWWVEWWAKDEMKDQEEEEEEEEKEKEEKEESKKPEKKEEGLEDIQEMGHFERDKIDTQF